MLCSRDVRERSARRSHRDRRRPATLTISMRVRLIPGRPALAALAAAMAAVLVALLLGMSASRATSVATLAALALLALTACDYAMSLRAWRRSPPRLTRRLPAAFAIGIKRPVQLTIAVEGSTTWSCQLHDRSLEPAIVLGDPKSSPTVEKVFDVLHKPYTSVVAVLLGLPVDDRPKFFASVLSRMPGLLSDTGRPHWLVLDEAHHLLSEHVDAAPALPAALDSTMLITVHPDRCRQPSSPASMQSSSSARPPRRPFGPSRRISSARRRRQWTGPRKARMAWPGFRGQTADQSRSSSRRRGRASASPARVREGTLGPDKSFYFRGPHDKLRLRAQNLGIFLQMADGVDDDTSIHHLRNGDYSTWIRTAIKDDELADEIAKIERAEELSAERTGRRRGSHWPAVHGGRVDTTTAGARVNDLHSVTCSLSRLVSRSPDSRAT